MVLLMVVFTMSSCGGNKEPIASEDATTTLEGSQTALTGEPSQTETSANPDLSKATTGSTKAAETKNNTTATKKQDTAATTTSAPVDNSYDKPAVKNTAPLMKPVKSTIDSTANSMRDKILNAKDTIKAKGTTYYISPKGNDQNDGKSPSTAWESLLALNAYSSRLKPGDAVLFERGGVYRGSINAVGGVSYGAYGSGDKPAIYGSKENSAKAKWTNTGNNIWQCETIISGDIGIIVFNHGEATGTKKSSKSELKNELDFCSEAGRVFLKSSKNPADAYKSIEIGAYGMIITIGAGVSDVTIENLTLKYVGMHGIRANGNNKNITIRNCEVGWLGGSLLKDDPENRRAGNGIEFWMGCENILVESNWIYQIYDSGITHQGTGGYVAKNVRFKDNLIEYVSMGSLEYWLYDGAKDLIDNVSYTGNICRFAGYGWSFEQRPDKKSAGHIMTFTSMANKAVNFTISNNIFELSKWGLIAATSKAGTPPVLSGNTYIQTKGGYLGEYGKEGFVKFDDSVENVIKNVWGDKTAKVVFTD